MSLTGTFSGTTANERITPTIAWSAVQSVAGNYSDITATLTYRRSNDYVTGGKWEGSLTVGDQTVTGKKTLRITDTEDAVAISATFRVLHDNLGALTVRLSATGSIAGSTLSSTTIGQEITLDPIARASAVSASDGDIGSRVTVVVSRKNSGFSHSIAYRFGNLAGYMDAEGNPVAEEVLLTETVFNFLLPESFYYEIPDAPTGVCQLTCRTYHQGEQIGSSQTAEFTVTAAPARCGPVVTGTVRDANPKTVELTGTDTRLVRHASVARCTIDAQGQKGAAVVHRSIAGVAVTEDTVELAAPAFGTVAFEAVDSRGYRTVQQVPVELIPYVLLTNNAVVQRTDPTSGNGQLILRGSCWKGNFGTRDNGLYCIYRINGGTPVTEWVEIGEEDTYQAVLPLTGLDYTKSHGVEVKLVDSATEVTRQLTVQKGIPVFDWGEADFRFHVPVEVPGLTIGGVSLEEYIGGQR